ncbi:MAG: DUF3828 domain-containing protein [Pyrinomonadaceae bacterium]
MKPISVYFLLLSLFLVAVSTCSSSAGNINVAINTNGTTDTDAVPAGTPAAGSGESQTVAAEALVADLYKQHDAKKSPFFQTKDRALVDKYFTKATADLIWKDAVSSKGEVGALDGDPLYAAQDMEIKNFAIGNANVKGETATVPVNFTNYGQKNTITFLLKMVSGSWKIDDIKWPEGDSMVKVIKDNYPSPSNNTKSNEFEGKFQVGDTTCTVKPVKMAFEVRWAKGSGVEMFFFKDGYTFESSPDKGEPNRFEFDDENYTTGIFYRADGKTFPVKRAK